jgi:hypothetical protein
MSTATSPVSRLLYLYAQLFCRYSFDYSAKISGSFNSLGVSVTRKPVLIPAIFQGNSQQMRGKVQAHGNKYNGPK